MVAADLVGKILRAGRSPPIFRSSSRRPNINLIAAKALGLDVSPTLLAIADDEVIE